MKRIFFLFFFFIFLNFQFCLAQENYLIDSLYVGGREGFMKDAFQTLRYPKETKEDDIEGYLIAAISVDTQGIVSAQLLTYLDDHVEQLFTSYLNEISVNWINVGPPYKVYLTFVYNQSNYFTLNLHEYLSEFPSNYNSQILPPLTLSAFPATQLKSGSGGFRKEAKQFSNRFARMEKRYRGYVEKDKMDKAYESINELIRFNPFNQVLLVERIELERSLSIDRYRKYDIPWIVALRKMKAQGVLE